MKICLVSQEYPPQTGGGGIGTQTYLKAHGLAARGHEVHVVSASWDREARQYLDGKAFVHRIPAPGLTLAWLEPSTYWLAYSMVVAEKLYDLSKEVAFDVMQFPEYAADGFIYQTDSFKARTARYVVQCHGPLVMFAERMGWPEMGSAFQEIGCFMEGEVIRHSDLVLASSHCIASMCADRYRYPVGEIHVIHSGVDINHFVPQSSSDEAYPKILFVGNFVQNKGFDLLIETILRMRTRYPRIVLRMIGKGNQDDLLDGIRRIEGDGAQANFDIRGYVAHAELPKHYGWCDIFAAPSTFEPGAANVYLEAMACGKPVIACNSGGAPEAVQNGERGLLISPGSSLELEEAIRALADDRSLQKRFGQCGRAWVEANVSMEKYVDKVERLYQAALTA